MPDRKPRGTFRKIADAVRDRIENDTTMTELPSASELMDEHGVSRGLAMRAFAVLKKEGLAEPVPGGRWRVIREGEVLDRRPLAERIIDILATGDFKIGDPFLGASELGNRLGVSRPTTSKALDRLWAAGFLSEAQPGKLRIVRALPPAGRGTGS